MIIVCPSCATEHEIDPAYLRPNGRKLRCSACRTVFFADAPADEGEDDALNDDWAAGLLDDDADAEPTPAPISVDAANNRAEKKSSRKKDAGKKDVGKRSEAKAASAKRALPAWLLPIKARLEGIPLALFIAVIVAGGTIGALLGRESVVRSVPSTALLFDLAGLTVNLRGLEIANVTSGVTVEANGRYLTIEGDILNPSSREQPVPPITISLWGEARQTLYSWSIEPPRAKLSGGETVGFRARLVAPPDEARQVLVRFAPGMDGTTIAGGGN